MDFANAMRFVEGEHGFPTRPEDRHARRLAWLLARSGLGRRIAPLPRVVVAGSCGKASTARLLAFIARALFDACGVPAPVGLGTKPPVRETADGQRERYQRLDPEGGRWIPPGDFARHATELASLVAELRRDAPDLGAPAAYELRAWLLARYFDDISPALGVVEANIGLRDDPAGALPPPSVQVLTPIGDDHASVLRVPAGAPPWLLALGPSAGPTWHKAGGLFPNAPVVVGAQAPEVLVAIERLALERTAGPRHVYGRDFLARDVRCSLTGSKAVLALGDLTVPVELAVVGRFQVENAAVAAMSAAVLQRTGALPGDRGALRDAIVRGLARADTPGRMQLVGRAPTTLLTVGATSIKAAGTVETVRELVGDDGQVVLCLSEMARVEGARRAVEALAELPRLRAVVTTRVEREGDNADAEPGVLASWVRASRTGLPVQAVDDPDQAIALARSSADPGRDLVLLVGNGLAGHVAARAGGA